MLLARWANISRFGVMRPRINNACLWQFIEINCMCVWCLRSTKLIESKRNDKHCNDIGDIGLKSNPPICDSPPAALPPPCHYSTQHTHTRTHKQSWSFSTHHTSFARTPLNYMMLKYLCAMIFSVFARQISNKFWIWNWFWHRHFAEHNHTWYYIIYLNIVLLHAFRIHLSKANTRLTERATKKKRSQPITPRNKHQLVMECFEMWWEQRLNICKHASKINVQFMMLITFWCAHAI